MSLLDKPKNFGLAAIVIGIVSLLIGIIAVVNEVISDDIAFGAIIAAVGTIIYGMLILGIGLPIYRGEDTNALSILGKFVGVIGLATIVVGIFSGAGSIVEGNFETGIVSIIVGIVFGIILIWVAKKIVDGYADLMDSIIWFILLVVFIVLTIVSLVGIITPFMGEFVLLDAVFVAVLSFCEFILYAFLLMAVLSKDVKTAMGI